MNFILNILRKKLNKRRFYNNNKEILKFEWINVDPIENILPDKINRICFVIPAIGGFGGGFTSILRLGSYLQTYGYDVTYASFGGQPDDVLLSEAKKCLQNFKGRLIALNKLNTDEKFDIVIATNVFSVYYAKNLSGYKMTFVQDYEPYFYEAGDYNLLAKKSYELGFHMVSLGAWNRDMILKHINDSLKIDTISFPYEKSEYRYKERDFSKYAEKDVIKLCVYMRNTPRRLPGVCQIIVKKLQERFKADNKELKAYYFGEDIGNYEYGKNLGKLNKEQLSDLYQQCDFGMVASYTNISLVPYEMMATGLPIIEFYDGSFKFFFGEDDAFLFDFNYDALYEKIKNAIDNPEILIQRNRRVQSVLGGLSWDSTAREFEAILKGLISAN